MIKLYILGGVLGAFLLLGGLTKCAYDDKKKAETAAAAAAAQAALSQQTTAALDVYATKASSVRERTVIATRTIRETPSADTPLPEDLLASWRSGIDRVRDNSATATAPDGAREP